MTSLRNKIKKNPIVQLLSSIRITVTCLTILFILTLWGTIDQVYNGLYHAQQQFFHSWFFLALGFFPLPGGQLVLWILFINLVCVALTRFVYNLNHLGILIIHIGLLTYFVAAFITFVSVKESNLTLYEGEGSNLSTAYHDWELSVWQQEGNKRKVVAYDLSREARNVKLDINEFNLEAVVQHYYPHSEAYSQSNDAGRLLHNDSGVRAIHPLPTLKEPEKNMPGAIVSFKNTDSGERALVLYGGETSPTKIIKAKKDTFVQLRRRKMAMPFVLKLIDFRMEVHPNTEVARSYESMVEIKNPHMTRNVLISMNQPLRYKDFTLYQASYAIDAMGRQISTLAVVQNAGRLLPYIASFITFAGLVVHFLVMGLLRRSRKVNA